MSVTQPLAMRSESVQSTLEDMDELANLPKPKSKAAGMDGDVVAKLHLVEKHIRKNKLQVGRSSK